MAIEKIKGIVTDTVKYNDRHNIVTLFTREHGRVSFLSPAGTGKTAKLRNASLMNLSVISADINFNPTRELQFLGRFQREFLWKDIYFNPVKSSIALFIAEFVNNYSRQLGPDPALWDYVLQSVKMLDDGRGSQANFHLGFLTGFMEFAGIRPDLSEWREDAWFDMRGGTMTILTPTHNDVLIPADARIILLLSRLNIRTAPVFRFNSGQRRQLLQGLLRYYSLHFPGMANLKSPEILSELFA